MSVFRVVVSVPVTVCKWIPNGNFAVCGFLPAILHFAPSNSERTLFAFWPIRRAVFRGPRIIDRFFGSLGPYNAQVPPKVGKYIYFSLAMIWSTSPSHEINTFTKFGSDVVKIDRENRHNRTFLFMSNGWITSPGFSREFFEYWSQNFHENSWNFPRMPMSNAI